MKFQIEKRDGKFTEVSRSILREKFSELPDGRHLIETKRIVGTYTPTRYKYYFDCVMWMILQSVGDKFLVIDPVTKERRKVASTKDVHEIMKLRYNAVTIVDKETGEVYRVGSTTTNMNDRSFIAEYLPKIQAEYADEPHWIEFPDYEDWKMMHNEGSWNKYKNAFLTTV